jgi:C4-dicarboxylate-specific signal transduction histidine kinase
MAAGLAHEFSQPLNIIRLASESALILMEEDEADVDWQRKQFEKINGQAERMTEIVNHVNSFARVDVGEPKPFDPVRCIEEAIALASGQFGTDDVVITTRMPGSCSPVLGHRVRLEQVVVNLLNNARDATLTSLQRKPGALSKGEIAVEVADDAQKDTIHVLVTDNGGGIPPDLIKSLFEPFFTTKPMGRGTGLGLSISADIIADMGGTIEVMNVEGGARFEIALPVYAERE